jgi:hypothetical protein
MEDTKGKKYELIPNEGRCLASQSTEAAKFFEQSVRKLFSSNLHDPKRGFDVQYPHALRIV